MYALAGKKRVSEGIEEVMFDTSEYLSPYLPWLMMFLDTLHWEASFDD